MFIYLYVIYNNYYNPSLRALFNVNAYGISMSKTHVLTRCITGTRAARGNYAQIREENCPLALLTALLPIHYY